MATSQSNQQRTSTSEVAVVLYVTDKSDVAAFQVSHLRDAGYELHAVFSPHDALEKIEHIRVNAVVIGHRLGLTDRIQIEDAVRRLSPKPRVVLLYETSISQTEQADAVLNINSEPQHLAQTIRYLLTGTH
jgi:CheY-like chemotaxis protein